MAERFSELARVEDELRADLRKYAQQPNPPTPLQLKPRIRSHPAMAITSKYKMGAGRPMSISFENSSQQTVSFPIEDKDALTSNINVAHSFISSLSENSSSDTKDGMHIWKDVATKSILDFINTYKFSNESRAVNSQNISGYIKRQNSHGELVIWDVVLPAGNRKLEPVRWLDNIFTHKVMRAPLTSHSISVLSDPNDKVRWQARTGRDLKDPERGCIMIYTIDRKSKSDIGLAFFDKPEKAEDILGLVFIFPESNSHETVEYISQD